MATEQELELPNGRIVRFWDTGVPTAAKPRAGRSADSARDGRSKPRAALTVIWHHGTPQTGRLLEPVVRAAAARGIRVVSCARAGYPGTSVLPGRTVADATADVVAVAAALGLDRYAAVGASGGGPHALACAALDPDHVIGVVTLAGIAPYTDAYDWFAGMASPGALSAALSGGRDERQRYGETAEFDESSFIDLDWEALQTEWAPLGADANRASIEATEGGAPPWGEIDDDVAFTSPWGFELSTIGCPTLHVQGGRDRVVPRSHGEWLAAHLGSGECWLRPNDGHISVLRALPVALDWLIDVVEQPAR